MKSVLSDKHFHNEQAAYDFVEARLWPNGPVCPHCGGVERISKMGGKSTRIGAYKCYQCRKPFTVKVGTIFESSHVPLRHWLQAIFLMSSSKKGISSNQLHRTLGCTLKTAWFISHRLREAMRITGATPLGSAGKVVEADETFIGRLKGQKKGKAAWAHKNVVFTLVERGGEARSFHVDGVRVADLQVHMEQHLSHETNLHTDELAAYKYLGKEFASHESVAHSKEEYVRGEVHTNTVEGFYSIFKRGMKGIYQHCSEKHLHRYLSEFDFRYSNRIALGVDDVVRAERALKGVVGKRLKYRTTH
ncbi:MAG: IS1595 family transposase [Bradyrhizobium sp.]|uniref:IS1595 family transposase n=1 Tax=Bradyrhizobium sp. TaxID=376 RepID=UPI00239EB098|nr:IS1595 family transposase [Bradyrhizobium sp.]MDE2067076.1 IS1595 family transposase [Bradyrhizobium sp.]MDE2467304.1 IS1595 family transposase [Bradyrhizobium sp.]